MASIDLEYWDEDSSGILLPKKKGKKKEKEKKHKGDGNDKLPLSQEYLNHMADILEQFFDIVKTYFIYPDLTQEEFSDCKKHLKKIIHRMRKGDTSDYDEERTMEAIENGDIPEKYICGG